MRHFPTLLSHELRMLLVSPATYVAATLFLGFMGLVFTKILELYGAAPQETSPAKSCPNCGAELPHHADRCPGCGFSLRTKQPALQESGGRGVRGVVAAHKWALVGGAVAGWRRGIGR